MERKRDLKLTVVRHDFKGNISLSVYCSLVIEIIKQILYMRLQIPIPYVTIKKKTESNDSHVNTKDISKQRLNNLKDETFVKGSDEIFRILQFIFNSEVGSKVEQILLILGSTIISPKEIYKFTFNPLEKTGESMSLNECLRSMFKTLMSPEFGGKMCIDTLPVNNIFVMVLCPRESANSLNSQEFLPKINFSPSFRNTTYDIQLKCIDSKVHIYKDNAPEIESSSNEISEKTDNIWFQIQPKLKGYSYKL